MRFGLTQIDPSKPKIPELPPYSLPDLIDLGKKNQCYLGSVSTVSFIAGKQKWIFVDYLSI